MGHKYTWFTICAFNTRTQYNEKNVKALNFKTFMEKYFFSQT